MASSTAAGDDVVGPQKGGAGGGGTTPPPPSQQQQPPPPPPPDQVLRCPRCDSPNTKFCYYNNYSLSQPRHFCKTCRRYWTKGGALRNVPVGGGCRKNKRSRSTASAAAVAAAAASSRLSLNLPVDAAADQQARLGFLGGGGGAPVVVSSSPIGGATAADYHHHQGGAAVGMMTALPRLHAPPAVGHYVPFGEWPASGPGAVDVVTGNSGHTGGAVNSSIASSIESLSFINQDLHWKLQQQRLATMFLGPTSSSGGATAVHVDAGAAAAAVPDHVVGGPFLHMAGAPAGMEAVPAVTSWFMADGPYMLPPPPANNTAAAIVATTIGVGGGNIDSGRSSAEDDNATSNGGNCGSASIPAWGDMATFAMLP
ncbi:hypothetical protein PR202_gb19473 [Eleusine coracana subsp. coracana]|uniref:Dof zinc finger protein n=1 Tax=Eleusine coracana subsp. coracana TaxID=191504 RepID=A0AAV5F866_ELECO|nr:hypothetical protein QOZ80_3BG0284270 [Eleusine coracana subsp. coracana]GJN31115.1 hypothetical protein PR202_gb19473 [Eleusine coracana subsp. coracana]